MDERAARAQMRLDDFIEKARAINSNPECAHNEPGFDDWVNVGMAVWDLAQVTGWPINAIEAAAGLPLTDLED